MDANEMAARLGPAARIKAVAAGQVLFRRGDPARNMFGVLSGAVQLTRDTAEGARLVVHRARTGALFAEASLFSAAYHCDGEAQADSTVALFPKEQVLGLVRADPEFALAFCSRLAGQVQRLRTNVELRAIRSAEDRVLAALSLKLGDGQRTVTLEHTWKAFAQEIGLTHEALYRALRRLEDDGRIVRDGVRVTATGEAD